MGTLLRKYFWVFTLLGIVLCAALLGRATAGVLIEKTLGSDTPTTVLMAMRSAPIPVETPRKKDIELILRRNIFCSSCAPQPLGADPQPGTVSTDDAPRRSTLSLQLLATMVSPGDYTWSMAVLRDNQSPRKQVGIYRRSDALPEGGAVLAQVVEGRVYLVVSGHIEYIDQTTAPPPQNTVAGPAIAANNEAGGNELLGLEKEVDKGVRCNGASCEVDRSLVDKILANSTALPMWARFIPSIEGGKPTGFKIAAIRPGSLFAKLGMQNADLVKAINGLDMTSPDKVFEAYTKLKSASHLTMQLVRRGENLTFDYQIR